MSAHLHPSPRARAAALLAAISLALTLPSAVAAVCDTELGARVVATGGPVTVRVLAPSATFTSKIYRLETGHTIDIPVFLASSSDVGATVAAGTFTAGSELQFLIRVDPTGYEFRTGPASRNPVDRLAHARVTPVGPTTARIAFEDFAGTSDRDFDDVIFEVDGAHPEIFFAGLPMEPGLTSRLECDAGGRLLATPIAAGGNFDLDLPLGTNEGVSVLAGIHGTPGGRHLEFLVRGIDGAPRLRLSRDDGGATVGDASLTVGFAASSADLPITIETFRDGEPVRRFNVQGHLENDLLTASTIPNCDFFTFLRPVPEERQTCHFDYGPDGEYLGEICGVDLECFPQPFDPEGIDEVRFTLTDPVPQQRPPLGPVEVSASGLASLAIESQSLFRFGNRHTALGATEFHPNDAALSLTELGTAGEDGVAIDLGSPAETFEARWKPLLPVGLTVADAQIALGARGRLNGSDDQDLGTLTLRQADGKVAVEADYAAVGSPTQRIMVFDRGALVADIRAHTGTVAHLTAWPKGAGKGGNPLPDGTRLPCYQLPLPEGTWIDVPGGPKVLGDQLLVLAETGSAVEEVTGFSIRTSKLPSLDLVDETVTAISPPPPVVATCEATGGTLCLEGDRFAAEVSWRDARGRLRRAEAVPLTREAGYFRFADATRPEVGVKLFDGRSINGHWWVYVGGLSRSEYLLAVTDLERGETRTYRHPAGRFSSRIDERAFAAGGAGRAAGSAIEIAAWEAASESGAPLVGACTPAAKRLCLAGGRFEAAVLRPATGSAPPRRASPTVPLGDMAGYFWFTEAAGAEVFVKAYPRRAGGGWSIVYGSLTESAFDLRVLDRATGEVKTFHQPARRGGR